MGSPVYGIYIDDGADQARTLAHIRDEDALSITAPLRLYTGKGDRLGFWAGLPVYAPGLPHDTVEERRKNLRGIVQGVFQIGVMFDSMLAKIKTPTRLYVFSANAGADDLPVYYSPRAGSGSIDARSQSQLAAALHRSFSLDFGDVKWTMVVTPEASGSDVRSPRTFIHRADMRPAAQRGRDVAPVVDAPPRPRCRNRK